MSILVCLIIAISGGFSFGSLLFAEYQKTIERDVIIQSEHKTIKKIPENL